ncbi:phage tail-collar fiber domain-containing protein [Erwinia psidii]|uniref:Phage tail fibre protein N-terminal domain-containing protein n=1 Tax=Erwinia psidii TaxID=69224 RepID=A0A3N6USY0_9GAMM|nr:phage tail protein [Erwinia psidii]RQM39119.1 hypothetical protein EB241_05005 [Erwinia psidii]
MSTIITTAFENWLVSRTLAGERALADTMIFALIPDQSDGAEIDRDEGMPAAELISYQCAITQTAALNANAVVYSVVLDTTVGDWDYNWIGLADSATDTLLMIVHLATQRKIKTQDGQQGNSLVRNLVIEFNGAAEAAQINVTPETWQIDFSARLGGIDERQRIENRDIYGAAAFFDDGFLVNVDDGAYRIQPGVGYVGGLRVTLDAVMPLELAPPATVWVDACFDGTVTGAWSVQTKITVADALTDYSENGRLHYVYAVASIADNGDISDLRPSGSVSEQQASDALARHERSRNHPAATLDERGLVSLSNDTDSDSEDVAATSKAVNDARISCYPLTGGALNGEAYSYHANNWRLISENRGVFWRFDGSSFYLMFTDEDDPLGSWGELRPLIVECATGNLISHHGIKAGGNIIAVGMIIGLSTINATGSVFAGGGNSQLNGEGNVYGGMWGGWLDYWIKMNFIQQMRLGAAKEIRNSTGSLEDESGYVVTMGGDFGADDGYYRLRPVQEMRNGVWTTIASV